jgi:hypothetical protein
MSPLTRSVALLALAANCTPRAGNDPTMTPHVVPARHAAQRFAVVVDSAGYVAVFAVRERRSGWSLQLLTPDSESAPTPALRNLYYSAVELGRRSNGKVLTYVHYMPARRCVRFRNWTDRADSAKFYDWGCVYKERAVSQSIRFPPATRDTGRPSGYYLIAASTTPLTTAQWTELADSTGVVAALIHVPERLGQLAFGADSTTRWAMTVEQITRH